VGQADVSLPFQLFDPSPGGVPALGLRRRHALAPDARGAAVHDPGDVLVDRRVEMVAEAVLGRHRRVVLDAIGANA